jgi:hypothetical protein
MKGMRRGRCDVRACYDQVRARKDENVPGQVYEKTKQSTAISERRL